jgi:hypothetical protein
VSGEGNHAHVGQELLQAARGLHAVHGGHPDVHEHDVGPDPRRHLQCLRAGARLPDDLECVDVEQGEEGIAEAVVVVDDHHANPNGGKRLRIPQLGGGIGHGETSLTTPGGWRYPTEFRFCRTGPPQGL